ncbi:hypothetical protein IWX64_001028 [Arthrobacter sp. CAN_A212]|uniref:hypothetical protein n=1 Tax=Arthrobacter sp. CAN_A212 TaxID=2787719 RepID=UPI0018C9CD2F
MRQSAATSLALGFLIAGAGCSLSPGHSSILTDEGLDEICFLDVPPSEGTAVVGEVINNNGDQPVTIMAVTLLDARDILIEDAYIIPMEPGPGTAIGASSTLTKDPEIRARLDQALPAEGYVIDPGEQVNIVVAVSIPAEVRQGTASGIDVRYEQQPNINVTDTRVKMTMAKSHAPEPSGSSDSLPPSNKLLAEPLAAPAPDFLRLCCLHAVLHAKPQGGTSALPLHARGEHH